MGQFSVEIYALPGSLLSGNQHSWEPPVRFVHAIERFQGMGVLT